MSRFLTVKEVAERLRLTPQTVYLQAAANRIPHYRVFGGLRFDPEQVDAWVRERACGLGNSK